MVSTTIQAGRLQDAMAPVNALVDECKIQARNNGLQITAVDPANVGMVDMELSASACAQYQAGGETIGLNLERLVEVLGMADSDDMVSLSLDDEARRLQIETGGLEFSMALIDQQSIRDEPDIPDLDLPGVYVFGAGEMERAVKASDLVSDHIEIEAVSESLLTIRASGDTDDVEVDVTDGLLSGRHATDEAVSSLFSLEYLQDMIAPVASGTEMSLQVGDEMPIKLQYSLADGDVSVLYMLAPRVQSEGQ